MISPNYNGNYSVCYVDKSDDGNITELEDNWVVHIYRGGSGLRHRHGDTLYFDGFEHECMSCRVKAPEAAIGYLEMVRYALNLPTTRTIWKED